MNAVCGVWPKEGKCDESALAHRIMPLIHCCSQPRKEGRGQPENSGGPDSGSPSGTRLLRLVSSRVYLRARGWERKGKKGRCRSHVVGKPQPRRERTATTGMCFAAIYKRLIKYSLVVPSC